MREDELLATLIKGALVVGAVGLLVVGVGFLLLVLAPFAVGLAILSGLSWLANLANYGKPVYVGFDSRDYPEVSAEELKRLHLQIQAEDKKQLEETREQERLAMEKLENAMRRKESEEFNRMALEAEERRQAEEKQTRLRLKEVEKKEKLFDGSFESLSDKVFLESSLPKAKCEELFAKHYKRLKISPFGNSGSTFYWVYTRYNESKEHAFFCYLVEALMKSYCDSVGLNVNNGPDVVCQYDGVKFCFDVETGKSLSRQPEYLERKFHSYKKLYDASYILVINKTLKYKYNRYGIVVTRGKLKQVISKIFS